MRGAFGLLRKPSCIGSTTSTISSSTSKQGLTPLSAAFSTSSGGDGSGRGRGRGAHFQGQFAANEPEKPSPDPTPSVAAPRGHGRGRPLPSSPFLPSFNTFVAPTPTPSPELSAPGLGRGRSSAAFEGNIDDSKPKKPLFISKDEGEGSDLVNPNLRRRPIGQTDLSGGGLGDLSGMGRGKTVEGPVLPLEPSEEENRHVRSRKAAEPALKLSPEEAKKRAVSILMKDAERSREDSAENDTGRTDYGGRQRGRLEDRKGYGRGGDSRERRNAGDGQGEDADGLFVGNDADGEKFAQRVGPEVMNILTQKFEEISSEVLPSVAEDEYLEAMDINLKIELEPEYLMADFETNPDIDEKPPIPLRDALEKMKPFLMAYEGIQNEEEWKEIVDDTMKRVPLLKEIVDYYAGPDSVTAKQQQEEMERVAKTLPATTPDSVRQFTNRAVLTLQSNPGWGFDKKCQFMDKLVAGVSQVYNEPRS